MAVADKGIDIREDGSELLIRAALTDADGVIVTTGTTTVYIYEYQADGSLYQYDFNDQTFRTGTVTTKTSTLSHQQVDSVNTGIWTKALTQAGTDEIADFEVGAIYVVRVTNTNAVPDEQFREFQWSGVPGIAATEAKQDTLAESIGQTAPVPHTCDSITKTTGTSSDSHTDTHTLNATYLTMAHAGNIIDLKFNLNIGADRIPDTVTAIGRFVQAGGTGIAHFWSWNYISSAFEQISVKESAFGNTAADISRTNELTSEHVDVAGTPGNMIIRLFAASNASELRIDKFTVRSVPAAGLTLTGLANAVHAHNVKEHTDHDSAGFATRIGGLIDDYAVTSSGSALSFTCSSLPAVENYYQFHKVQIHDVTNDREAGSWISAMNDSGVVTLGRALPFTPDTSAEMYVQGALIDVATALGDYDGPTKAEVDTAVANAHTTTDAKIDTTDTLIGTKHTTTDAKIDTTDGLVNGLTDVTAAQVVTAMEDAGTILKALETLTKASGDGDLAAILLRILDIRSITNGETVMDIDENGGTVVYKNLNGSTRFTHTITKTARTSA